MLGTFTPASGTAFVTYSLDLTVGPIDTANWVLRHNGFWYLCGQAFAGAPTANRCRTIHATPTPGAPPGTAISYEPPPYDLLSDTGVPALPFADLELTVL